MPSHNHPNSATAIAPTAVITGNEAIRLQSRTRPRDSGVALSLRSLAMTVTIIIACACPAYAQPIQPNDGCIPAETGRYRMSGGPDLGGEGYLLSCNGGQWVRVFGFDTDGIFRPQLTNTASCQNGQGIVYDTASGGLRCAAACDDNTPDAINFADIANADASTVIESNIVRITGINCQVMASISGQGTPQYRICDDALCDTVVQDWTDSIVPLVNNHYVQMRLTSSAAGGDTYTAHLVVGGGAGSWKVTPTGDCAAPAPAPGTICDDGTVYAGISPDGNVKMYAARCDEGQSWNGMTCAGSRLSLAWNNGNGSGSYVDTGVRNYATGAANTAALVAIDADSITSGHQNHQAARRCADATHNGHTDWYLPAIGELVVFNNNQYAIDYLDTAYMSSTEHSLSVGFIRELPLHRTADWLAKSTVRSVRCMRKE